MCCNCRRQVCLRHDGNTLPAIVAGSKGTMEPHCLQLSAVLGSECQVILYLELFEIFLTIFSLFFLTISTLQSNFVEKHMILPIFLSLLKNFHHPKSMHSFAFSSFSLLFSPIFIRNQNQLKLQKKLSI